MQMMWTPFVNQSAPHESARYQNDNCRRSFPFRDGLILYISQESQDDCLQCGLWMFQISTMANFDTEVYGLLKLFGSSSKLVQAHDSVVSRTIF